MSIDNPSNQDQPQDAFSRSVKEHLIRSEDALPANVVSRLRQSRTQALEQVHTKRTWLPAATIGLASCATVIMAVVMSGYFPFQTQSKVDLIVLDQEAEILFAEEELELYEDLEFYRWLASAE